MKYYKLFDVFSPEGDLYRVDEETGKTWMLDAEGKRPLEAFGLAALVFQTTQFQQLQDYASKNGRLEEAEAP